MICYTLAIYFYSNTPRSCFRAKCADSLLQFKMVIIS